MISLKSAAKGLQSHLAQGCTDYDWRLKVITRRRTKNVFLLFIHSNGFSIPISNNWPSLAKNGRKLFQYELLRIIHD